MASKKKQWSPQKKAAQAARTLKNISKRQKKHCKNHPNDHQQKGGGKNKRIEPWNC